MKININSFCNYPVSLFNERIQTTLTAQQQKILSIVGIALGLLAACYVVKRYCLTRCSLKPVNGKEPEIFPKELGLQGEGESDELSEKTKTCLEESVLQGTFEGDDELKEETKILADGTVFQGKFKDGSLHGQG